MTQAPTHKDFTDAQLLRYARHIVLPELGGIGQGKLMDASVLVIGHNPGLAHLAAALAPRGDRRALARMREKYPTSGLAVIHLHIDRWEQIEPGAGTLTDFMVPAALPERA